MEKLVERVFHRRGRCVALAWFGSEGGGKKSIDGGGNFRIERDRGNVRSLLDGFNGLRFGCLPEGMSACEHLVQQYPNSEQVRPLVHGLASGLFGGQVVKSAFYDARDGIKAAHAGLCDPKISKLDLAACAQKDI